MTYVRKGTLYDSGLYDFHFNNSPFANEARQHLIQVAIFIFLNIYRKQKWRNDLFTKKNL